MDRVKEEIGWLKVYFGLFFVADASLTGWMVQHWDDARRALLVAAGAAILTVTAILAYTNRKVYKLLAQLERR